MNCIFNVRFKKLNCVIYPVSTAYVPYIPYSICMYSLCSVRVNCGRKCVWYLGHLMYNKIRGKTCFNRTFVITGHTALDNYFILCKCICTMVWSTDFWFGCKLFVLMSVLWSFWQRWKQAAICLSFLRFAQLKLLLLLKPVCCCIYLVHYVWIDDDILLSCWHFWSHILWNICL